MTEVVFDDMGYFFDSQIEAVKSALEGKTYMSFEIAAGICGGGNYRLIVRTKREDTTEDELRSMFLHAMVSELWEMQR